ncbi:MAG: DUF1573 domain-containing protein [Ferruginibacter sp.]|mgnify:CR=1 FL=1|jgi:hypothetical protein
MTRTLLLTVTLASCLLIGCDVRKTDKIATHSQQDSVVLKYPTTVQLIDSLYDFGTAKEGEIVEYSYRFKNTGSNPLVVTNVSASCGCTVADKPEAPVKPGEIGFIKVKFNSEGRPGEARKTITVTSNVKPSFPELVLKGTVSGKE